MSSDFTSPRQRQVNEPNSTLPVEPHSVGRRNFEPGAHRKQKSRMVSFRIDEDDNSNESGDAPKSCADCVGTNTGPVMFCDVPAFWPTSVGSSYR
jgi:hypothetical protein